MTTQTSGPANLQGSARGTGRAARGEATARPTPRTEVQRLKALQIRRARARARAYAARPQPTLPPPPIEYDRMDIEDAKLRRCRNCGEWAYGTDACAVCRVPAGMVKAS